jgi:hypothetical protein
MHHAQVPFYGNELHVHLTPKRAKDGTPERLRGSLLERRKYSISHASGTKMRKKKHARNGGLSGNRALV